MGKGEIGWKDRFNDGRKRQVYAKRTKGGWDFFEREKRFEPWRALGHPSLADWLALLDGVERRVPRRIFAPGEPARIRGLILQRYPEAKAERGMDGRAGARRPLPRQ